MKGTAEMEEYKPAEDFVEFKKDSDINLTDATELWLIQWPLNLVTPLFPFTVFQFLQILVLVLLWCCILIYFMFLPKLQIVLLLNFELVILFLLLHHLPPHPKMS